MSPQGRLLILSSRFSGLSSLVAAILVLGGCVPLRDAPRAAPSSLGCARSALRDRLPPDLPDKQTHCRAAALIAARCSVGEAHLVAVMKEVADLLGPGNAEWADLRADWAGVRCARAVEGEQVESCCEAAVQDPSR